MALALSPSVAAASASRPSRTRRFSRSSRRGARARDQPCEARLTLGAEPDQPLDAQREAGIEGLQAPFGAELEEGVGLQARLLGLPVLARAGGGLHAVQRQGDEVVVRLVGGALPRVGHGRLQRGLGAPAQRLDRVSSGHPLGAPRRLLERGAEAVEVAGRGGGPQTRSPGELVLEVRQGSACAAVERDGLLDLEVLGHLAIADAAPVLDRYECEELQELLGPPCRLLAAEWRGREARERGRGPASCGAECARVPGRSGRAHPGEGALRARRRRGAAVLAVTVGEDGEVARGLRCGLGLAHGQRALPAGGDVVQQLAQARLVGVEQVLRRGSARTPGARAAGAQVRDGQRRVGDRAREARGGAEIPDQQPRPRPLGVPAADRAQRHGEGAAQHRGPRRPRAPPPGAPGRRAGRPAAPRAAQCAPPDRPAGRRCAAPRPASPCSARVLASRHRPRAPAPRRSAASGRRRAAGAPPLPSATAPEPRHPTRRPAPRARRAAPPRGASASGDAPHGGSRGVAARRSR